MKQFDTPRETLDELERSLESDRTAASLEGVGWIPSDYHCALYRLAAVQLDYSLEVGSLDWDQWERIDKFEEREPWTKELPR